MKNKMTRKVKSDMIKQWYMSCLKNNGECFVHDLGVTDEQTALVIAFNIAHYNYNDAIKKSERLNYWRIY